MAENLARIRTGVRPVFQFRLKVAPSGLMLQLVRNFVHTVMFYHDLTDYVNVTL